LANGRDRRKRWMKGTGGTRNKDEKGVKKKRGSTRRERQRKRLETKDRK